jgi:heme/copper-type cytochrome/quinol oxidase subunit 2
MRFAREGWRGGRIFLLALVGWLAGCNAAWAAITSAPSDPSKGLNSSTYVLAYILVIFGIALGMLFVCRASNRRERAKPEQFGESKALKKEEDE